MAVRESAFCTCGIHGVAERDSRCSFQPMVFDLDSVRGNQPMDVCSVWRLPRVACAQASWSSVTMWLEIVISGAGGNRTPVPQVLTIRDTTIPDYVANAATPAGGLITEVIRGSTF